MAMVAVVVGRGYGGRGGRKGAEVVVVVSRRGRIPSGRGGRSFVVVVGAAVVVVAVGSEWS